MRRRDVGHVARQLFGWRPAEIGDRMGEPFLDRGYLALGRSYGGVAVLATTASPAAPAAPAPPTRGIGALIGRIPASRCRGRFAFDLACLVMLGELRHGIVRKLG
jgi:hypothetical protein